VAIITSIQINHTNPTDHNLNPILCGVTGAEFLCPQQQRQGLELPPGMPGIPPALVTLVPGTAVAKDIPARDTIIPG